MRKNIVGFSSTSGRGISKTKALFDHLSLAYIVLLCPALLTHTQNTEKRREQRALSLSLPQSLRFAGFFR